MLTRRRWRVVAALLAAFLLQGPTVAASAAPGEVCLSSGFCYLEDIRPAVPSVSPTTSGTSNGGASAECSDASGRSVPCYVAGLGWYEQSSDCYLGLMDPQPPPGSPLWDEHAPGEGGALYTANCGVQDGGSIGSTATSVVWRRGPPTVSVDPAVLARRAIAAMQLQPPLIRTAPPQGSGSAMVGLPVWMWTDRAEMVTGPITRSATDGPVSVEAAGVVTAVTWDMGDGTTVVCSAGTPYSPGMQGESPDCGHVYARASSRHVAGGGPWPVTATSTWTVTWSGGGQSGTETLALSSSAELFVGELHVLNQDGGSR